MEGQQFDEAKLLKRARELMREEVKYLGGSGFIKKWKTEEAFIVAAVKAEKKRVKKLLRMLDKHGADMSKKRKTKPKAIKLDSTTPEQRKKMKKPKRNKPTNGKKSQSIRKAPRASRSASARRRQDLRTSDGKRSKVTTYKVDQEGNIIEKK